MVRSKAIPYVQLISKLVVNFVSEPFASQRLFGIDAQPQSKAPKKDKITALEMSLITLAFSWLLENVHAMHCDERKKLL